VVLWVVVAARTAQCACKLKEELRAATGGMEIVILEELLNGCCRMLNPDDYSFPR
jgi:hypothetical protein